MARLKSDAGGAVRGGGASNVTAVITLMEVI